MSGEVVQTEQRKANLEAITRLGFAAYPHKFDTTHSVTQLVEANGAKTGRRARERRKSRPITAGRIVGIRSFGKASFLVLSDGRSRLQVYVRQDALSERDYQLSKLLDVGDQIGVAGHLFRTKTNELSIWASQAGVPREVFPAAAGEVARPAGCRGALPPALSRSGGQSGRAPGVRDPHARHRGDSRFPDRQRVPRSRDADDAADRRRRAGAPVRDASQRARHEALPAHRARVVSQAAHGRGHRTGLRD